MFEAENRSPVARAMHAVRREDFLPPDQRKRAAEDNALPIACQQTISQPSLVAHMTSQLELASDTRVLEIGTGSGYQTAILAEIAGSVFTVERIEHLAATAQARLRRLGYDTIHFRIGDGALGWPEAAPFDAIIVTAAARRLPAALLEQLAPGGRLVAPIGSVQEDNQDLVRVDKDAHGRITERVLGAVRFVPLVSATQPDGEAE